MAGFQLSINGRFWVSTEAVGLKTIPSVTTLLQRVKTPYRTTRLSIRRRSQFDIGY
jgi:hypothetical protein